MRIYTKSGDLAFKTFTFPDGQPHFKLETYERDFSEVTIETAIKNADDLLLLALSVDVLRNSGFSSICLDCRYLLSARMDRAISSLEPFSLSVVSRIINGLGLTKVRLLDVHSEVATRLIRNSTNVIPLGVVRQVLNTLGKVSVAIPDKGATERVRSLCANVAAPFQCYKKRDPETGQLSGFEVNDYHPDCKPGQLQNQYDVLIVDDICDGGGTFVGLAKELRKAGAKRVNLFVTHGIFSKGLEALVGIDKIFTTDSYCKYATGREFKNTVVIPISMKELP